MNRSWLCSGLLLCSLFILPTVYSQTAQSKRQRELTVNCGILVGINTPPNAYGFAMANLVALSEARDAVRYAVAETNDNAEADTFTWVTSAMRTAKMSTNHYICAKQAIAPFASPALKLTSADAKQKDNIKSAAEFLILVYDQQIDINDRLLKLLKSPPSASVMSDELSTLQVERGERWKDLIVATSAGAMMLVELKATDEYGNYITPTSENQGMTMRLQITKREKDTLLAWMDKHFPELKDGTADADIADPAKMVRLYYTAIENRLAKDEPARRAGVE